MTRESALIFCLLLPVIATRAEPPPLRNNPFSRPPAPIVIEDLRPEVDTRSTPLELVATIVSTSGAFANVEGTVLRPGQEIRGYLLKHVFENRAVFERDGNELTVYVKPELEENDEQVTPKRRRR